MAERGGRSTGRCGFWLSQLECRRSAPLQFLYLHGPPHFHAVYREFDVTVEIETGVVLGRFPRRALSHVLEWAEVHRAELLGNWNQACQGKPLRHIAPLE